MEQEKKQYTNPDHAVYLSGIVTRPDLRFTPGGLAVFRATLAGQGQRAHYVDIQGLGKHAEKWGERLAEGTPVLVRAHLDQYKDRTRLQVEQFRLLGGGKVQDGRLVEAVNLFAGTGFLVSEPELRHTKAGNAVANARVLFRGRGENSSVFVTLEAWDQAEALAALSKGTQVFVQGSVKSETWIDREGNKRYTLKVVGRQVVVLKVAEKSASEPVAVAVAEAPEEVLEDDLPF